MRELLIEIWTSIKRNKLRTFLTGFSVAWGIFMLVILLGSGNGLKNGVTSNFGNRAINSMDIYGGWTSKPYMGYGKDRSIDLKNRDLDILVNEFPEITEIAARSWFNSEKATHGSLFINVSLQGVLPKLQKMRGINVVEGRFINQADMQSYRKVMVIDESMQRILFSGASGIGKAVKIGNSTFTVIGIYKADSERNSSMCYIPLSTGQLIYTPSNPYVDTAIFTVEGVSTDAQMDSLEKHITRRLAVEHKFDPTDESAIYLQNNMEQYKNMMVVFNGISIFVWIIGLGTLLAGIVGVSNIMLVTVTERTAEFGIRKALGAKPSSIIRLILTESVLITALFGYIGMVLGVGVMEIVNYVINSSTQTSSQMGTMFLNPTLDLSVAVSATIVLVLAGLVAGYIPAYRAAQLKTIDALRHNK